MHSLRPSTPGEVADHRKRVRYIPKISAVTQLPPAARAALAAVEERFAFRANDYYLGLINWNDPYDPIRQLVIPRMDELRDWGRLDASNEAAVTVARGVQHKYPDTVLLLCNEVCGAYCRYCFRKRLFMQDNEETTKDVSDGLRYIAAHPEVSNVLLTGGDPLVLSTRRLREIISELRAIDHVRIIRIGSKMPAFDPFRITQDPELLALFREFSTERKRIYLMAHFDHPRELTPQAVAALEAVLRAGVVCCNQCPLIRGVNDDPAVLAELFAELSAIGCPPYYLFQGRPTAGNEPYELPLVEGCRIFTEAMRRGSGLASRPRYVMSHALGKLEILSFDESFIYVRFHRAKYPQLRGRFIRLKRNDEAYWLDDLELADGEAPLYDAAPNHDGRLPILNGPIAACEDDSAPLPTLATATGCCPTA